jgi:ferredoxin-thioredoxin reductase catalytic subunit
MKLNPDKEAVKRIRQAIKDANGYCPCSLIRDSDHKCCCKDMRENHVCECGLYINE